MTFHNFPVLECPQNHQRKFADPEGAEHVLREILEKLPMTSKKGFLGKEQLCSKCKASMQNLQEQRATFVVEIGALLKLEPFNVEITGPAVRCPSCGHQQMVKTNNLLDDTVPFAITNAFDVANLKR